MNFKNFVKKAAVITVSVILILAVIFSLLLYYNNVSKVSKWDNESISDLRKASVSIFCGNTVTDWMYSDNASVGSGFFIDEELVMTSYHNLLDSNGNLVEECFILTYDNVFAITGSIYVDPDYDIAIIHFTPPETSSYPIFEISDRKPEIGESIHSVGTPKSLHLSRTVTSGHVTNTDVNGLTNQYLLMTDLPLSPGCSGSPIVDDNNRIIGMNAFKSTDFGTEGLSFAIYGDKLLKVIEDHKNRISQSIKEKVNKMGIEFVVTDRVSKGLIDTIGVTINSIADDSIFKGTVLEAGFEIRTIDSEYILTAADFYEKWKPGSVIEYKDKNGELQTTVIE